MARERCLRKIGFVFLITALLFSVLPVQAYAEGDIGTTYLYVAGTRVTEANKNDILGDGGSVRAAYDEDGNQVTLTLTNANISYQSVAINISSTIPLVIELIGENHITVSGNRECIFYRNNLTIQGSGTLELISAGSSAIGNSAMGGEPSNLVISGVPSLTAKGLYLGINVVGGVRIENSTVTVTCTDSYNAAFQSTQNIEISDSSVFATASGSSTSGINSQSGSISVSGSQVNVNSTKAALWSSSDITINDSTMELAASEQFQNCIFAKGTLTIENGSGVTATSSYPALYGATGLIIADSRVRATATADLGIWTLGNLSVSGDVDVVSNGIAMADGCTFTVTPVAGSLLEVKAGTSQTDAKHIADSPFAEQVTLSRINDAYCSIKPHQHVGGTATCVAAAICSDCGQSYGTPDTANHVALKAVAEKSATCTETGNIAYWYCEDCGKYFRDEACTQEIILEDTVLGMKDHQYQDGVCTVCGTKDPNVQQSKTNDKGESREQGQSAKPATTPERSTGAAPKTGDDTQVGQVDIWVFLLLASIAGLTSMVYYRKKKQ